MRRRETKMISDGNKINEFNVIKNDKTPFK